MPRFAPIGLVSLTCLLATAMPAQGRVITPQEAQRLRKLLTPADCPKPCSIDRRQSFRVELKGLGAVTFLTFGHEVITKKGADGKQRSTTVSAWLLRQGRRFYDFAVHSEPSLESFGATDKVFAVTFADVDGDRLEDIVLLAQGCLMGRNNQPDRCMDTAYVHLRRGRGFRRVLLKEVSEHIHLETEPSLTLARALRAARKRFAGRRAGTKRRSRP